MKLVNKVLRREYEPGVDWLEFVGTWLAEELGPGRHPLRFYVAGIDGRMVDLEVTILEYSREHRYAPILDKVEVFTPRRKTHQSVPFAVAQIVPTGIRCEFGGYAGDAAPATNLLASVAELVVTHPNAVNASEINEMAANVLYVEGRSLDDFLLGHVGLRRGRGNPIGTFIDPTGHEYRDEMVNVLNAGRASAGIDCGRVVMLDEEPGVEIEWTEAGAAAGVIRNSEVMITAVEKLLERGACAIGGLSVIHGVTREMSRSHLAGKIPNPSGSVEAIITHLISKLFRVPAAHAPLPYYGHLKEPSTRNPRASAEFISTPHYFCVLKGLHRAPRIVVLDCLEDAAADLVTLNHIGAVVLPASALGGIPAMAAQASGIPIIAVRGNGTILEVTAEALGMEGVIEVENYFEAAGVVAALRAGIVLESLKRPIEGVEVVNNEGGTADSSSGLVSSGEGVRRDEAAP
jgi:glycosyltransferase involved in cell wall biosynthesis